MKKSCPQCSRIRPDSYGAIYLLPCYPIRSISNSAVSIVTFPCPCGVWHLALYPAGLCRGVAVSANNMRDQLCKKWRNDISLSFKSAFEKKDDCEMCAKFPWEVWRNADTETNFHLISRGSLHPEASWECGPHSLAETTSGRLPVYLAAVNSPGIKVRKAHKKIVQIVTGVVRCECCVQDHVVSAVGKNRLNFNDGAQCLIDSPSHTTGFLFQFSDGIPSRSPGEPAYRDEPLHKAKSAARRSYLKMHAKYLRSFCPGDARLQVLSQMFKDGQLK